MPRFVVGDELGSIKTIRYKGSSGPSDAEKTVPRTIYNDSNVNGVSKKAIQVLAVGPPSNGSQLVRIPSQPCLTTNIHILPSAYIVRWRQVCQMVLPPHSSWATMTLCKPTTSGKRRVCALGSDIFT